MPGVTIRFATPAAADVAFASTGYLPEAVIRRKIDQDEVVVAERSGAAIGCLVLEYLWSKVPYIALIWVDEGERRGGIGRGMLRFVEDYLRERGNTVLYSSSQLDEPPPQAWHRHMGFVECGIIAGINEGGVGEVFFRKELWPTATTQVQPGAPS